MVDGFILNNQLTDFSAEPVGPDGMPVPNRVEPGKRPRSTMAPTLIFEKSGAARGPLFATLGSPGGAVIIQFVVKSVVGIIDWGMDPQQAVGMVDFGAANTPKTPRGMLALPDAYQVRLIVDGVTYRQAVMVRMDPRVKIAPADLALQHKLSKSLNDAMRRVADARARTGLSRASADALQTAHAALQQAFERIQDVDARPTAAAEAEANAALQSAESALAAIHVPLTPVFGLSR
jgi:hypothetical protein